MRLSILALILALALGPADAGVVFVRYHAGPVFDGQSWATAFDSVQQAIDSAASTDEVWVAQGVYNENVVLKSGIAVYGGFAGTETQQSQRDFRARVTTLDAGRRASAVQVEKSANVNTRVDGFTITGGRAVLGGGVYCEQGSRPVIANNRIIANTADYEGGGIYCNLGSAPTIVNNIISNNSAVAAGGGVSSTTGDTMIANNIIASNSSGVGGGICIGDSATVTHETVANNTFAANSAITGGAIYCRALSAASVSNNIVALNSSGVHKEPGTSAVTLRSNCVYANDGGGYSGLSPGSTDISLDPVFASAQCGEYHIQPSSPCKEAGNNGAVVYPYPDTDGQARIQGTVDIGADESDGTVLSISSVVVRVTASGSDSNDGSAWDLSHAMRTVQIAIERAAALGGGEVWVRAGTYQERLTLRDHVHLYGGFRGTETARSQRDADTYRTTIGAGGTRSAVSARLLGYRTSTVDGFTITGGSAYNGAGIWCDGASPALSNNVITGNASANRGGGVCVGTGVPLLRQNTVCANTAVTSGGGIHIDRCSGEVSANEITGNSACIEGCGIAVSADSTTRVTSNKVAGNAQMSPGGAWGGGVSAASYAYPQLINNTLADNSCSYAGGIYFGPFGTPSLANCIVAFNSSGIWLDDACATASVRSNCLYSNTGYSYKGFTGGTGDISADPLFMARSWGDYHIRQSSLCVNRGDDSAVQAAWTDLDCKPRVSGLHVDIGCYEWDGLGNLVKRISAAKAYPSSEPIELRGKVVTAGFLGAFYIEEPDRTAGIRVDWDQPVSEGSLVSVFGTVSGLVGGERALVASSVSAIVGGPDSTPPGD